jgi:hypothetical protein
MAHWHARVTIAATDVPDTVAESLSAAVGSYATVTVDADRDRVDLAFDIDASGLRQATDDALRTARSAVTGVALPWSPTAVTVQNDDDFAAELGRPRIPDLVGYADIADILGVSRQRARELAGAVEGIAAAPDFPPAVARPSSGPLHVRSHIEAYAARRKRKPGRPSSSTTTTAS